MFSVFSPKIFGRAQRTRKPLKRTKRPTTKFSKPILAKSTFSSEITKDTPKENTERIVGGQVSQTKQTIGAKEFATSEEEKVALQGNPFEVLFSPAEREVLPKVMEKIEPLLPVNIPSEKLRNSKMDTFYQFMVNAKERGMPLPEPIPYHELEESEWEAREAQQLEEWKKITEESKEFVNDAIPQIMDMAQQGNRLAQGLKVASEEMRSKSWTIFFSRLPRNLKDLYKSEVSGEEEIVGADQRGAAIKIMALPIHVKQRIIRRLCTMTYEDYCIGETIMYDFDRTGWEHEILRWLGEDSAVMPYIPTFFDELRNAGIKHVPRINRKFVYKTTTEELGTDNYRALNPDSLPIEPKLALKLGYKLMVLEASGIVESTEIVDGAMSADYMIPLISLLGFQEYGQIELLDVRSDKITAQQGELMDWTRIGARPNKLVKYCEDYVDKEKGKIFLMDSFGIDAPEYRRMLKERGFKQVYFCAGGSCDYVARGGEINDPEEIQESLRNQSFSFKRIDDKLKAYNNQISELLNTDTPQFRTFIEECDAVETDRYPSLHDDEDVIQAEKHPWLYDQYLNK